MAKNTNKQKRIQTIKYKECSTESKIQYRKNVNKKCKRLHYFIKFRI